MKHKPPKMPPNAQKKYRHSQAHKGLVRFEFQVNAQTKARFDELVAAAADELAQPWDARRRIARARARVFDEITQGITHEFFTLKEKIAALKTEIKVLSPSFFKSTQADTTPLPEAIRTLPNDSKHLKALLANTYRDAQRAKQAAQEYQRRAEQFEALYDASSRYNEELQQQVQDVEPTD